MISIKQEATTGKYLMIQISNNGSDLQDLIEQSQKQPDNFELVMKIGALFWEDLQFEDAYLFFRRAVGIRKKDEFASKCLFHVLWDQERYDEAFEEMKRYVSETRNANTYKEIISEIKKKYG